MIRLHLSKALFAVAALATFLVGCGASPAGDPDPAPPPAPRVEACTDLSAAIVIPDPVFRAYLHLRTGIPEGQQLTCGALRNLTQLFLGSTRTVRSLQGVEHLQGATSISLDQQNLLTDAEFARLGALVNATSLSIHVAANLTSVQFAESLPGLELLRIDDTGLASLKGLENLVALRVLYVRGNPNLTSAAPVAELANLETVQLTGSGVSSLAPFNGKDKLKRLMATNNALTSIDVSHLPALEELQVTSNAISALPSISALGFPRLTLLSVANNRLATLAGLEGLTLSFLAANGNELTTIHHIADLRGVRTLYLNDNLLTDMTPLGSIAWDGGATVELGNNCLGVLYFPESGLHTLPAGPNNETWKDLTLTKGVNVRLLPVATDSRCDGKPGY